ncbi:MAG: FAD-dependent monooxygenase [Leptospiraceae bacterium]|nr:FAD-dependent monooxygenase [Leptospiraceae bacterium]
MQNAQQKPKPFQRAVVIGASIAGIMGARVLSDYFQQVILLDRDEHGQRPQPRKGTPQSHHIHVLLRAGQDIIEEFFPGCLQEIEASGGARIDAHHDFVWHHFGVWKTRFESEAVMYLFTRPLLEYTLFERLRQISNIEIRERTSVAGFLSSDGGRHITGVRLSDGESLQADLVLDASGRGSRTVAWLEELGYDRPPLEETGVDLAYVSRLYRRPATDAVPRDWRFLLHYPHSPHTWKSGFVMDVEEDRWIVSLNGYFKDHPPLEHDGFVDFARDLTRPDLHSMITAAEPLTDAIKFTIPRNSWRHFEKMRRFPSGLVLIGDAICALNPIFGQGMSVAGKEAHVLHRLLQQCARRNSLAGLEHRARKHMARVIGLPWFLTICLDLHYPQTSGKKPLGHGFLMWYISRLMELSSSSPYVYGEFFKVLMLKNGLWTILKPTVSLRVLAYGVMSFFVPLPRRANTDTLPAPAR